MVIGPETLPADARPLASRTIMPTESMVSFQVSRKAAGTAATGPYCSLASYAGTGAWAGPMPNAQ
jgi:hypothetical protein